MFLHFMSKTAFYENTRKIFIPLCLALSVFGSLHAPAFADPGPNEMVFAWYGDKGAAALLRKELEEKQAFTSMPNPQGTGTVTIYNSLEVQKKYGLPLIAAEIRNSANLPEIRQQRESALATVQAINDALNGRSGHIPKNVKPYPGVKIPPVIVVQENSDGSVSFQHSSLARAASSYASPQASSASTQPEYLRWSHQMQNVVKASSLQDHQAFVRIPEPGDPRKDVAIYHSRAVSKTAGDIYTHIPWPASEEDIKHALRHAQQYDNEVIKEQRRSRATSLKIS